jgi:phosphoribosylamine--glycine ligase
MENIGILVVSYGSRAASIVDAFSRSNYNVKLYIADKQKNPFNLDKAEEHVVIPDLSVDKICAWVKPRSEKINFGVVCPEGPIIAGIRDVLEKETGIPMVCPTKEFALEESKVAQREIMAKCVPEANPRYKVFRKAEYKSDEDMKKDLKGWLSELDNQAVVKPDRPGYGKGVGVWGDHFNSFDELYRHFMTIYEKDSVIIEEKVDGEESSYQCFCDGVNLVGLPDVRDYKRAFDDDAGPNTGGMGSYKDASDHLPFMSPADREKEGEIAAKLFKHLKGEKREEDGLRGPALYLAYMHTKEGPKILEINSRGGDPEFINIMSTLKDDYVDVCFDMIDGCLKRVRVEKDACVLTYKVPSTYGGFAAQFPGKVKAGEVGGAVDLSKAYRLSKECGGRIKIYPGSLNLGEDGMNYALGSRTVACVGIAGNLEEARELSLKGVGAVTGGGLWCRSDVASKEHIGKSIEHMRKIRS